MMKTDEYTSKSRPKEYCSMRIRIADAALKFKGWSMKELAKHLHVEHQTVMYWNQGRTYPKIPTLMDICKLLECSLDDLIEDTVAELDS
jgi:transcriptional regulator with XRE-family HTH domain